MKKLLLLALLVVFSYDKEEEKKIKNTVDENKKTEYIPFQKSTK